MTICTIDVHARDVVAKLIAQKASVLAKADLPLFSESAVCCQGGLEQFLVFQRFLLALGGWWVGSIA